MADMTKCPGDGCTLKETCKRYLVRASSYWQSYFVVTPLVDMDECEFYIAHKEEEEEEDTNEEF